MIMLDIKCVHFPPRLEELHQYAEQFVQLCLFMSSWSHITLYELYIMLFYADILTVYMLAVH